VALSDEDVREILRIIDESHLDELQIETEGFALHVRKGPRADVASDPPRGPNAVGSHRPGTRGGSESTPPAPIREPALREKPDAPADGLATITAPMLGTFYRAEAPGKPPFVEVGARVEPDTIVCIIEVMKMMNSVLAGVSGKIAEVVPENAALVEYGQTLFRVEAA
jgi:acetyl-CoA carboxylase biotin carboxyl carrier protein